MENKKEKSLLDILDKEEYISEKSSEEIDKMLLFKNKDHDIKTVNFTTCNQ